MNISKRNVLTSTRFISGLKRVRPRSAFLFFVVLLGASAWAANSVAAVALLGSYIAPYISTITGEGTWLALAGIVSAMVLTPIASEAFYDYQVNIDTSVEFPVAFMRLFVNDLTACATGSAVFGGKKKERKKWTGRAPS